MAKEKKSLASQLFSVVVFIILLVVMLNMCSGDKDEPTNSYSGNNGVAQRTNSSSAVAAQAWYEKENKGRALIAAQNAVKRDLNYPSSAKFEDSFWVGLNGGVVIPGSLQKQEYSVTSWVDSQNAFGATIRTKFIVFVKQVSDGRWEVMEDSEGTPQIGLESEGN